MRQAENPDCGRVRAGAPVAVAVRARPWRRYRAAAWLIGGALLLAGCVSTPVPELNPPLPQQWRNAPVTPDSAAQPAPLASWWQALEDAELDALVQQALQGNLTLAQASERVRAARRLSAAASDRWLPSARFATDNAVAPDRARSYILPGFDAQWELPLFGASASARRVAAGGLAGVEAAWRGARVSLIAEVVRAWIELREAQAQAQGLQAQRALQVQRRALEQRRVALGLAVAADDAAAAALGRLDVQLSTARQQARLAAQQLALLLGVAEPDPVWLQPATVAPLRVPAPGRLPVDQLRHQPAIAEAEAGVVSAAGALGMRRADLYPHVGLGAALQWVLETTNGHLRGHGTLLSVGPSIEIPLFDWGQRLAQRDAARDDLQAALLAYRAAVLQAVHDVESALIGVHEAAERTRAAEAADTVAGAAEERSGRARALQLADRLDLIATRLARQQAMLDVRHARAEQVLAWVALNKTLGAGAPADALLPRETRHEPQEAGAR